MAQLNLTSSITAAGLTSDTISSTVQKIATVSQGGVSRTSITAVVAGTPEVIGAHAAHAAGTYVYLKNADTVRTIYIKVGAGATAVNDITLLPGAWAMFPWGATTTDISAYASANNGSLLEFGFFE